MGVVVRVDAKTNKFLMTRRCLWWKTTHSAWVMFRVQPRFKLSLHLISMWRLKVCTLHDYTKLEVLSGLMVFMASCSLEKMSMNTAWVSNESRVLTGRWSTLCWEMAKCTRPSGRWNVARTFQLFNISNCMSTFLAYKCPLSWHTKQMNKW